MPGMVRFALEVTLLVLLAFGAGMLSARLVARLVVRRTAPVSRPAPATPTIDGETP